jgi:hypothetical protein
MKDHENTCSGCGKKFTTPQGLGLHFTLARRANGGHPCSSNQERLSLVSRHTHTVEYLTHWSVRDVQHCNCGAHREVRKDGTPLQPWHTCELCTHAYGLAAPDCADEVGVSPKQRRTT